jgi:hypothetical protein
LFAGSGILSEKNLSPQTPTFPLLFFVSFSRVQVTKNLFAEVLFQIGNLMRKPGEPSTI